MGNIARALASGWVSALFCGVLAKVIAPFDGGSQAFAIWAGTALAIFALTNPEKPQ